jgi:hypothetical protein
MGKRELLLIIGFVIIGAVVYHATAPPPGPNDRGFSFSRLIDAARREIGGNRAAAEHTTTATQQLTPEVNEVRIIGRVHELEVIGENRTDIESVLRVTSRAYEEAEARRFANETVLKTDRSASSIAYEIKFLVGRQTGVQRGILTLKVPARLRVRIEGRPSRLEVSNVSAVDALNVTGETSFKNIAGRLNVVQRGGPVQIEDVAALKFNGRGTELTLKGVRNDTSLTLEGGEVKASGLLGPVEIESRNAEITLADLESTRGPIRVNAVNGNVQLKGVKTDTRLDGRNAELDVMMSGAAPVSIYNDGADVTLTPPPAGYRLDALALDGRISPETLLDALGLQHSVDADSKEARASGAVRGGGPTITVRATRGSLTIRESEKIKGTK